MDARAPHRAALLLTLFAGAFLACSEASVFPPAGDTLALGTWGGSNAGVIVTDTAVHVHVGCTFGDMPGNVQLDADGRFTVNGTYVLRAYPIVMGPELPAQFSGRVIGRRLLLAVAVNDTVENQVVALGPITVELGHAAHMGPCPICRAPSAWRR